MENDVTMTLWRPVGEKELQLIQDSGWKSFPPRLPEQPIFYPVCNIYYARQIANDWNARNGQKGYVLQFEVKLSFICRYERQVVGRRQHEEYWIPTSELDDFNQAIVGLIQMVEVYPRV